MMLMSGCASTRLIDTYCHKDFIIPITKHDLKVISNRLKMSLYAHNRTYLDNCG